MPPDSAQWLTALGAIRLIALDVDGVLTDGRVVYAGEEEVQHFHVHDGAAIAWLRRAGIEIAWITGRGSKATQVRAKELGITELHVRALPKAERLAAIQARLAIPVGETLAMGDDLQDFGLFERAGVRVAPSNARPEVRARADFVTLAAGGQGAVREMAERVLRARGAWDELVASAGAPQR